MQHLTLKPLQHLGKEQIGIYCEKDFILNEIIHQQAGARWSQTHGCWYLPMEKQAYEKLVQLLAGKVTLQNSELRAYLIGRKGHAVTGSHGEITDKEYPGTKRERILNTLKSCWDISTSKPRNGTFI